MEAPTATHDATAFAPAPANLASLREQHEAARLSLELLQLNTALEMVGGAKKSAIMEAWGDLIDPSQYLLGDPSLDAFSGLRGGFFPTARLGDRQQGRNFPIVQTEQDLMLIRGASRLMCDTSPAAIGVLKNLTNFIVGTGFKYKAAATTVSSPANGYTPQFTINLLAVVQQAVDEFIEANNWSGDLDREVFIRSRRDGESFLALYATEGGHTAARIVEPEQVTEPRKPRDLEDWLDCCDVASDWTFGVHTKASDIQTVLGYFVQWNASGTDWDYLPADSVEHIKLNVDRNIKRGLSDFFASNPFLHGAQTLLDTTHKSASIQAAIAYIVKHAIGQTQGQVGTMAASQVTGQVVRGTQNGGQQTVNTQRYSPGTVLRAPQNQEYELGPMSGQAGLAFLAIEQAVLRYAGTRWCMPEYMVSGDASNANYSSTMVAESPFVKNAEAEQQFYKRRFGRIMWKVIRNRFDAGAFRAFGFAPGLASFDELRRLIDLQIEAPEIAVRDDLKATKIREILWEAGILSETTWSMQEKLDREQEVAYGATPHQKLPINPFGGGDTGGSGGGDLEDRLLTQ